MGGLIALMPAHNEAQGIQDSVASVLPQVDRVIVVADNCTDDTEQLALDAGAEVFRTVGNTERKAGALNQALDVFAPEADAILVADADTTLSPGFVAAARPLLEQGFGAVGGIFRGEPTSLIERLQALEYARFAGTIERTRRVQVLTGTASIITTPALVDVRDARARGDLPGCGWYDSGSITEDNEMSLALRSRGHRLASPAGCTVTTELMPTVGTLIRQRTRWYRGALDDLDAYGMTRATLHNAGQQLVLLVVLIASALWLGVLAADVALGLVGPTWWLAIPVVFAAIQTATCWSRTDWRGRLVSGLVVPDAVYALILQIAYAIALTQHLRGTTPEWHHPITQEA